MEAQPQSGPSSAAYPRWVMFEEYLEIIKVDSSCFSIDEAKTLASARTSAGRPIQVSLRLAEPPALSRVLLRIPDGTEQEKSKVLAAHGDSLLIQVLIKEENQRYYTAEHFVYNGGAVAAEPRRPPSLWLLPPYYERTYSSGSNLVPRELFDGHTGLLRRGEDELVVAELTTPSHAAPGVVSIYLFRSGECKWRRYHLKFREAWDLRLVWWSTVAPVDDHRLCWVGLRQGVMLIDVFVEPPTVQYVRLPMDAHQGSVTSNRNVCATVGGGALRFVNIFGRCCCGTAASCECECARHAYVIHTWTLRISNGNGDMGWVKDGMIDATELLALDGYKGLPCNPLDRPIVSMDQPEVICFRLRAKNGSRTLWQILVNTRSKTILAVSRHEEDVGYCYTRDKLIPSNVSYFFSAYPSSGRSGDDATLTGQKQIDIERSPSAVVDEKQPEDVQASEIFDLLQEIPSYGLGPEEVKAYRVLSKNNGRRLRSLLRLPKNLRKNWLLMEIKSSED